MISLTINGQTLEVPEHTTVLDAANQVGIVIPTLCHHEDLTPYGGCRLCSVDIQGLRLPATACTMPVSPGMVVHTESPALTRYRRTVLELLLVRFHDAGYTHTNGTSSLDTQFAYWVDHYGIDMQKTMATVPFRRIDRDPNPYIWVDKNKCIMCTRCVRACAEMQGRFVWIQAYRGYELRIVAGADTTLLQARCESCGACVAHCPTGALDNKMSVKLGPADRQVTSVCPYCGVGCTLVLNVKGDLPNGRVLRVTSLPEAPVNGNHLCVKGRYGYDFIHSNHRLLRPRVRQYLLDGTPRPQDRGPWVDVDWDAALEIAANGFRAIRGRYGPGTIGILTSGKCLNEDNYLANKFARQVIGTNNIDVCDHVYRSSVVEGLDAALGLHAQTNTLDDVANQAMAVFLIGSNTSEQHPVFGIKLRQAVLRRSCQLVVAHPDFINMSEYAALRLVNKPGTETELVNGIMHLIVEQGWANQAFIQAHTKGFKEFKSSLAEFKPSRVAKICGVSAKDLRAAAELLSTKQPMAVVWGTDLTYLPSGSRTIKALINLQLLLGNFGQPGSGLIPLRCLNNSQGASDMGGHPSYLPGYQPVQNDVARRKFETAWSKKISPVPGMTATQMMDAAAQGKLRALYVLGEDLVNTSADGARIRQALCGCSFIVFQGVFESETSRSADVILPSVTFAEKTGTFTNTERRVQMVRAAFTPLPDTRPDWQIIADLAQRIKAGETGSGMYFSWEYDGTDQIIAEVTSLTPIYAGISHARLRHDPPPHWPVLNTKHPGTPILSTQYFSDQFGEFSVAD